LKKSRVYGATSFEYDNIMNPDTQINTRRPIDKTKLKTSDELQVLRLKRIAERLGIDHSKKGFEMEVINAVLGVNNLDLDDVYRYYERFA
jgi:hypothetical protein